MTLVKDVATFFGGPIDGYERAVTLSADMEPELALHLLIQGPDYDVPIVATYLRHIHPDDQGRWVYHYVPERASVGE